MPIREIGVLAVALAACVTDLRSHRIPNLLTVSGAAAALVFHVVSSGWTGAGVALGGWLVGLVVFLPLFALRGLGGGDVKLVAALGAWLGPGEALWLGACAAMAGGVMALVVAAWRGYLGQALGNVWSLLMFWRIVGVRPHPAVTLDTPGAPKLPYSLPILAGLIVVLWRG